jgi:hypothetical protein
MDSRKCASGHVTLNFCFCIRVRSVGHVVHFSASRAQNVNALFSCSGQTGTDFKKTAQGHITPNLYFASGGICGSHSAF